MPAAVPRADSSLRPRSCAPPAPPPPPDAPACRPQCPDRPAGHRVHAPALRGGLSFLLQSSASAVHAVRSVPGPHSITRCQSRGHVPYLFLVSTLWTATCQPILRGYANSEPRFGRWPPTDPRPSLCFLCRPPEFFSDPTAAPSLQAHLIRMRPLRQEFLLLLIILSPPHLPPAPAEAGDLTVRWKIDLSSLSASAGAPWELPFILTSGCFLGFHCARHLYSVRRQSRERVIPDVFLQLLCFTLSTELCS